MTCLVWGRIWTQIHVVLLQILSCFHHICLDVVSQSGDGEKEAVVSLPLLDASICQACAKHLINFVIPSAQNTTICVLVKRGSRVQYPKGKWQISQGGRILDYYYFSIITIVIFFLVIFT